MLLLPDLGRAGYLGVHEPHLQLGDHVVPQIRQTAGKRQEPQHKDIDRQCGGSGRHLSGSLKIFFFILYTVQK